jgi:hypothetical protein
LAKAAPRARALKVYGATFGFHDSIVAASNQAEALAAWGVRQNLFTEGQAKVITDAEAMAAARTHPGQPLRRVAGTSGPFELDPTGLPTAPSRAPKAKVEAAKASPPAKPRKPPNRSLLDRAEAKAREVDAEWARAQDDLRCRREALDAEEAKARQTWIRNREAADRAVATARRVYLKAGGEP